MGIVVYDALESVAVIIFLPVLGDCVEFSQTAHQRPPIYLLKCTTVQNGSPPAGQNTKSGVRIASMSVICQVKGIVKEALNA